MHDMLIALVFVTLVASPAIAAAMPLRRHHGKPEGHANAIDLRVPSASASR